jgi:hypothetical protein
MPDITGDDSDSFKFSPIPVTMGIIYSEMSRADEKDIMFSPVVGFPGGAHIGWLRQGR